MLPARLRFGAFIAPFHPVDENPTLAIQRDLELVQHLDALDYDEAWIGEHHSAGYELIASPEVFIAAAAERTRHIKLGTGVASLPYHHPMMLADRMNQLDHMTRGRVMFGVGPGALVSDAFMMGIPVQKQRDRMDEALGVLVRLMRGEEVTHSSDWFELKNARLQMTPYSRPSMEMAVASQVSPTGARAAGRHGLGLLSLGATSTAGFNALASNWAIAGEQAAEHGQTMDRNAWRLVGPMHIAETREQAMEDVRFGLDKWIYYFREIANLPIVPEGDDPVQAMIDTGLAVIGTPDDCVKRLQQLVDESSGFGAFLFMDHNWAPWERKKRSYELVARYVFPHFQQLNVNREASMSWVGENKAEFTTEVRNAVGARIVQHMMEKGAGNIRPEIVELITGQAPPKAG
ncbi:LLM class flavin-dependent oxidoreductase [Phenylobacterium sp. J367]|uniref:LLM class flavin-dependent oxidoreductase n=1 Tax=Phenylobacterium sp. J367 TaxID=2898435 RepID=UPI0021519A67|nr:LLM class flavin-dependent oxidoreductase [Phenylobacterium sp. J367]MCR5880897.1 LLM class flavin-dependent oxidoreductase [Phenylobacterium sp. J367]